MVSGNSVLVCLKLNKEKRSEVKLHFNSSMTFRSKHHFDFEENEYDGLLIVFICDGRSESISISISI